MLANGAHSRVEPNPDATVRSSITCLHIRGVVNAMQLFEGKINGEQKSGEIDSDKKARQLAPLRQGHLPSHVPP